MVQFLVAAPGRGVLPSDPRILRGQHQRYGRLGGQHLLGPQPVQAQPRVRGPGAASAGRDLVSGRAPARAAPILCGPGGDCRSLRARRQHARLAHRLRSSAGHQPLPGALSGGLPGRLQRGDAGGPGGGPHLRLRARSRRGTAGSAAGSGRYRRAGSLGAARRRGRADVSVDLGPVSRNRRGQASGAGGRAALHRDRCLDRRVSDGGCGSAGVGAAKGVPRARHRTGRACRPGRAGRLPHRPRVHPDHRLRPLGCPGCQHPGGARPRGRQLRTLPHAVLPKRRAGPHARAARHRARRRAPPQRSGPLPRSHRHGGFGTADEPLRQREHPQAAQRALPALARSADGEFAAGECLQPDATARRPHLRDGFRGGRSSARAPRGKRRRQVRRRGDGVHALSRVRPRR